MTSLHSLHADDLIINQKRTFITEFDIESTSQISSGTPLPFSAADAMDQHLINILLQEAHHNHNPYHAYQLSEAPSLFFTPNDTSNQQELLQLALVHQHQMAINSLIAATTGSLFNPFTTAFETLAPLTAINAPPTMTMMQGVHDADLKQSSVSASTEGITGAKRSRASASITPEPQPLKAKKGKGESKAKKEPKPRPVNARALALDCEVLMLHEIDRPVAERMIRDKLGNNPDTSKSLRRLALEGKVVRQGLGGRGEPFRYELTERGKETYRELKSNKGRGGQ